MQSNLTPGDLEVLKDELRQRGQQLRGSANADSAATPNKARLERDLHELHEIEAALERIDAGTYGACLRCGKPIDRARLRLFPAARFDMGCMENEEVEHERQHATRGRAASSRSPSVPP